MRKNQSSKKGNHRHRLRSVCESEFEGLKCKSIDFYTIQHS